MSVRTRYAGSPTGYLHIGGAWMVFFNWLFARHHGGAFVLRVEDTDRTRSTEAYERAILEDIRWLGLDWDEGPDVGGPYGPYRQSERLALYRRYAQALLDRGAAYPCYCTPEELAAERERARAQGVPYRYSGRCRDLTPEARAAFEAAGRRPALRLRVADRAHPIVVHDLIRGTVRFPPEHLDDQIIVRSDGWPLYNFANVVDDHLMAITHTIRGAQHLSNAPKQLVMYEALGWTPPTMAHLPEILGPDRKKLSKRTGAVAVRELAAQGYLPEAVLNFLALMGWHPEADREVYELEELVRTFDIAAVGRSPAVFDPAKLTWLNGVHMRRALADHPERVVDICLRVLQDAGLVPRPASAADRAYVARVVEVLGDRLKVGADVLAYGDFFFTDTVRVDPQAAAQHLARPETRELLRTLADRVAAQGDGWDRAKAEEAVRGLAAERGVSSRAIIHPARVALTGKTVGPGLFELMEVLGRERVVQRLRAAAA
ncbi:MAG: glutamate--tRNA ligase [Armatimonadota bacterium]|nr:glutamate--tRNA ligase [Armatimonadota bacterium]